MQSSLSWSLSTPISSSYITKLCSPGFRFYQDLTTQLYRALYSLLTELVTVKKLLHINTSNTAVICNLGIMQHGKPVAYFSKSWIALNVTTALQIKSYYLLWRVMTLCEFRSMLLVGAKLTIHTDHVKLLMLGDSSQQWLRWISYINEYGPELK
jgi:hypothetical protein